MNIQLKPRMSFFNTEELVIYNASITRPSSTLTALHSAAVFWLSSLKKWRYWAAATEVLLVIALVAVSTGMQGEGVGQLQLMIFELIALLHLTIVVASPELGIVSLTFLMSNPAVNLIPNSDERLLSPTVLLTGLTFIGFWRYPRVTINWPIMLLVAIIIVGNQQNWDTLGPERSGGWDR